MANKSDWQDANRELREEARRTLGDPPTAEEMLAFTRGELSESEEERIRDLLVAYPELARMYGEPFPDEPQPGDEDYVRPEQVTAEWNALQQRLRGSSGSSLRAREEGQRGRVFLRHFPTATAAMFALVFFGLYVRAESRARYYAAQETLPRILGDAQELDPDGNRGPESATLLRKDGEAYLLKPRLVNRMRYPSYRIELVDAHGAVLWTNHTAQPDEDHAFQIAIPHAFLRGGETYQLRIFGAGGERPTQLGSYDVSAPAE